MKLSKLKPNPVNPRSISDSDYRRLINSIRDFPKMLKLRPLIIDNSNTVLGGNMRLKALNELGYKEIPDEWVKCADELTDEEKKRFIIQDNISGGQWDYEALSREWDVDEIKDWGLDMPEGWGEGEKPEAEEDDYEIPGEIETDIVLGDLIEIGEHRLLCGDSTDSEQVAKLMDGEKCHLLTDPPYGINVNKQTLGTGKKEFHRGDDWDGKIPDFYFVIEMCDKSIIWGGNYFADKLPVNNDWLCWHKKNDRLSFSEFELAWSNIGKNCRLFSHHWGGEQKLHPTMKPVKLIEWCINLFEDTQAILDVFLGSGSTMVAAHQLNRKCYGCEIDPKYCQIIIDRMLKLDETLKIKINGKTYQKTQAQQG